MQWRRELSWNPADRGWRIAALFMTGAFIFALGSFPLYARNVDPGAVGVTFVVGSVIFTAAYSSYVQVINDGDDDSDRFRYWAWQPSRRLWWAAVIQLAGTLFFTVSATHAMIKAFPPSSPTMSSGRPISSDRRVFSSPAISLGWLCAADCGAFGATTLIGGAP